MLRKEAAVNESQRTDGDTVGAPHLVTSVGRIREPGLRGERNFPARKKIWVTCVFHFNSLVK